MAEIISYELRQERLRYWGPQYGFTFVLGGPFSFVDCQKIAKVQDKIVDQFSDIVEMGDPEGRHLSLGTCDSGRSQSYLWKKKLDFPEGIYKVVDIVSNISEPVIIKPIKIYLRKVFILLHVEAQGLDNLRRELSFLGIKPIIRNENENLNQGHITLGVVKEESAERLEALSIFLEKVPIIISYINHIQADQMTIAHYRSRSFDKLLGAVVLGLGGKNGIDEEQFWRQLNLRE